MEPQEKKLIENLFNRLADSETNDLNRDIPADNLITKLLNKQPHASYYMAQTILVQETAINKLNEHIHELENKISLMKKLEQKQGTSSFLSNLFGSKSSEKIFKQTNDNWATSPSLKDSNQSIPNNMRAASHNSPMHANNSAQSGNGNSFLSGALQTATGVAGGMVMANMLTHLFDQKNMGEEVFNHTNNSHVEPDVIVEREIHDHYIHDNDNKDNISNNTHHNHDDYFDAQQDNDDSSIDISDDDNFI